MAVSLLLLKKINRVRRVAGRGPSIQTQPKRADPRPGSLEILCVMAPRKAVIDGGEELVSVRDVAAPVPQLGQAHGGPQLPRQGALPPRQVERLPAMRLRLQELAFDPEQFRH